MEKWTKRWPLGNPALQGSDIGLAGIGTFAALSGGWHHELGIMIMGLVLLVLLVGRVWAWGWYGEKEVEPPSPGHSPTQ